MTNSNWILLLVCLLVCFELNLLQVAIVSAKLAIPEVKPTQGLAAYVKTYNRIGKSLKENTRSHNTVKNLAMLKRSLKLLQDEPEDKQDQQLIRSLKLLTSLEVAGNKLTSCNARSATILRRNYHIISEVHKDYRNRLQGILYNFSKVHYYNCRSSYLPKFQQVWPQLDKSVVNDVRVLSQSVVDGALATKSNGPKTLDDRMEATGLDLIDFVLHLKPNHDDKTSAKLVYEALKRLSDDNYSMKCDVKLAYKRLENSCNNFINQTINIYKPLLVDLRTVYDKKEEPNTPVPIFPQPDWGPLEYRLGLAYYKICASYVLETSKPMLDRVQQVASLEKPKYCFLTRMFN